MKMDVNLIVDKILTFLSTTATALAQTGFRITMRQVIFEGIFWTVGAIIFLILSLVSFKKSTEWFNKAKSINEDEEAMWSAVGYLFAVEFLIIDLFMAYEGLQNLVAPEFHTVLKIIELVK
jgi:hypothetical protein